MEPLSAGASAPQLGSIATHVGRPRVLAFVRGFSGSGIEPIRGLLRGLGAELVVLAPAGAWTLSPDDALEQRSATA